MTIQDIINALNLGNMDTLEKQQMVAYLITELCSIFDQTIDREYAHLQEIKKLEEEVKFLHRMNEIHKAKLRK